MQEERAASLIEYFVWLADDRTWYSTVNYKGRVARYLFEVLSIPGLNQDVYKRWLKMEKISPSLNMDGIHIRKFGAGGKLHIAHGKEFPTQKPGEAAGVSKSNKRKKRTLLPPLIPACILVTNAALAPSVVDVGPLADNSVLCDGSSGTCLASGVTTLPSVEKCTGQSHEVNIHTQAAKDFLAGDEVLHMSVGEYQLEFNYDSANNSITCKGGFSSLPPLVEVFIAALARDLEDKSSDCTFQLRGNVGKGGSKRTYMRVTQGHASSELMSKRRRRRGTFTLTTALDTLSGGSDDKTADLLAGTLRKKKDLFPTVMMRTGIPLLHCMDASRATAMLEKVGINNNQYKELSIWLEAEWPEMRGSLTPAHKVRAKSADVGSAIAMETSSIKLLSKAHNGRVSVIEAASVHAISIKQAALVIAHKSFMSGKIVLDGQPTGEIWSCWSCDAGGSRNGLYMRYL